jgi:hypothetical protein
VTARLVAVPLLLYVLVEVTAHVSDWSTSAVWTVCVEPVAT